MILVTGATGFVGHQLVRAMRSRFPGRPIRILNRAPPQSSVLPDGVQVVLGDIADAKAAAEAVRGTHVVIHLAALQTNARVIQEMRRVNAEGARNLYTAAVDARVRLFVHMSSAAVYGPRTPLILSGKTMPANRSRPIRLRNSRLRKLFVRSIQKKPG